MFYILILWYKDTQTNIKEKHYILLNFLLILNIYIHMIIFSMPIWINLKYNYKVSYTTTTESNPSYIYYSSTLHAFSQSLNKIVKEDIYYFCMTSIKHNTIDIYQHNTNKNYQFSILIIFSIL